MPLTAITLACSPYSRCGKTRMAIQGQNLGLGWGLSGQFRVWPIVCGNLASADMKYPFTKKRLYFWQRVLSQLAIKIEVELECDIMLVLGVRHGDLTFMYITN